MKDPKKWEAGTSKSPQTPEFEVRTDLALEERESFQADAGEVPGVALREWSAAGGQVKVSEVRILNERGAKSMGKPCGVYVTLEAGQLAKPEQDYHQEVAEELAHQIRRCLTGIAKDLSPVRILAVGLGNPAVTPDALGPRAVGHLQVTRHLGLQYGENFCREKHLPVLSAIVPGVMAQTGMETAEILKGIIRETRPDLLIAIDALAARSVRRLGTTIQLTDTGIHPGSGVGNHRHSLTKESLGVPALAIGVPTVVGAAAIVHDTVNAMVQALAAGDATRAASDFLRESSPEEQYQLIRELLEPEFGSLYVTPPDIDERLESLSYTISEGIHAAIFP